MLFRSDPRYSYEKNRMYELKFSEGSAKITKPDPAYRENAETDQRPNSVARSAVRKRAKTMLPSRRKALQPQEESQVLASPSQRVARAVKKCAYFLAGLLPLVGALAPGAPPANALPYAFDMLCCISTCIWYC